MAADQANALADKVQKQMDEGEAGAQENEKGSQGR